MKLVDAEWSFEGNKVLFFFTAEGRVDFRALVKDLASAIHARIELRQIGVRDEAKMLGGLGICGRPFCCSQFLDEFQPVSIKMAKTQNLSLNPTKISGTCGRLMCCLKYEQEAYEDLVKTSPKPESFVETPDGAGTVSSVNLLRQTVQVRLDSAPESPKCYHNCELCVIRNGKGQAARGLCGAPPGGAGQAAQAPGAGGDPRPEGVGLPPGRRPGGGVQRGDPPSTRGVGGQAQDAPRSRDRRRSRRSRGGRSHGEGEGRGRPPRGRESAPAKEKSPPGRTSPGRAGSAPPERPSLPVRGARSAAPVPTPPPSQRRRGRQAPERRGVLSTPSAAEPPLLGSAAFCPLGKPYRPIRNFKLDKSRPRW